MSEFRKFQPANRTPDQFLRPPTEALRLPLSVRALCLEEDVNNLAAQVARKKGLGIEVPVSPSIRVGSELEIILFSSLFDASVHRYETEWQYKSENRNPNYSPIHTKNVLDFVQKMRAERTQIGLLDESEVRPDKCGRISVELRTPPKDVNGYSRSIDVISTWFQENAGLFDLNPVVWSQHVHLSLIDHSLRVNLLEHEIQAAVNEGLVDIYHRALPLLLLPENVDKVDTVRISGLYNDTGICEKEAPLATNSSYGPRRLEGRMNNSDYASDPYLNLLLHLIGIKRGLRKVLTSEDLDRDYPFTFNPNINRYSKFFSFGGSFTYQDALDHLLVDNILREELSDELLGNLHAIASQYPAISRGELGLTEARGSAYARVVFPSQNENPVFDSSRV